MKEAISDGFRQARPSEAKQLLESHSGMPVKPSWYSACTQSLITSSAVQVANYIFGNNQGGKDGEKIAMTSPVGIEEDFRSMKGGNGEKIAMTSPVTTSMDGKK